ncbi:hypothetical protein BST22_12430 [Mycolicibacterium chubuense]|uniref:DUF559 domain-containing protein n=1 Tax=Mycolicibacterium chubuense TaxID=1800 RepID=A0A0J6WC03_MYCCU|nr:DUF559 domain-containing protein [Mycolicibacterium chubuense]KMO79232.1 hypothetical protein MCHUDSM44219_02774 [Mycolicibacterium chubuense]ORA52388.1 hypothetical protein BST22_12430 [Mycolicibacterium chubuense]SPX99584.1 cullin, a subunit of E3 ubiquitin ligase [Mycolicibacterium chubuense]
MPTNILLASEALAAGQVTRRELARDYTKLFQNVYVRGGLKLTAQDKAVAAWLWSGRSATVAGVSAAALLGSRFASERAAAELIRAHRRAPKGIAVFTDTVADRDVCRIGSVAVTKPARTAFDIGRRHPVVAAVQHIDALLHATGCRIDDVRAVAGRYPGVRSIRRLMTALSLADTGAESPTETLTRLFVVAAGLPRPVTQIPVQDADGRVRYRLDMGWPDLLVAVEYDGGHHWTDPVQRARDIERWEFLAEQGWTVIRVSWTQLRDQPNTMVRRVAKALGVAPSVQVSHASLERCVENLHTRRGGQ